MSISKTHRIILTSVLILSPVLVLAQDPIVPTQPQTMPSASASSSHSNQQDSSTNSPGQTGQEMQDKKFLRDIAQSGLAETKMGQLASSKASTEDVRSFASKTVSDQTLMNKDLASVADSLGFRLPKDLTKPDQAEYDKLSALSGDDFDKEYLTVMLADHRRNLRAFRQESISTSDTAIHAAIEKSFAVVREHMGVAVKLAREKGIAVPPPPGRSDPPAPPAR